MTNLFSTPSNVSGFEPGVDKAALFSTPAHTSEVKPVTAKVTPFSKFAGCGVVGCESNRYTTHK